MPSCSGEPTLKSSSSPTSTPNGGTSSGVPPYAGFELPFVDLRGIPAMRHQDNAVAVTELQLNYKVNPRWSLLGFGGAGQAAERISGLGSEETKTTIGSGFCYLIARRLDLRAGIDIARDPEEWAFYLQFGNAWLM